MNGSTFGRVWARTGVLAAPYRVMFPLAALWAAMAVGLFQWGGGMIVPTDLRLWHVHEMIFGFGGAALTGYLGSACSAWTSRAPINGWRVGVMVLLWIGARAALLIETFPIAPRLALAAGVFWWLAAMLFEAAWRGGRQWRPGFIIFCLAAGVGSAAWVAGMETGALSGEKTAFPVIGVALLLAVVGGSMVPAFLRSAAACPESPARRAMPWLRVLALLAMAIAAWSWGLGAPNVAGQAMQIAGLCLFANMLSWPWSVARRDCLLAMMMLGYLWLPAGLWLWGSALTGGQPQGMVAAIHLIVMGAMGGMIMAVAARPSASRTPAGIRAHRWVWVGFALISCATVARVFGALDIAAMLWIGGWMLFLLTLAPGLRGPVPRPIFSGTRTSA